MDAVFEALYSDVGRPSIAPELLLKSLVLQSLYAIRSERQLCEQLQYNFLYRWFLRMDFDTTPFDHSTLSRNRERLLEHEVAREFFTEVVKFAQERGLLSNEHFSVDGTLIQAYGSQKSFQRKDDDEPPATDDTGAVDFRGQKRCNDTHQSRTDPEALLAKKSPGEQSKLSHMIVALTENRNGLVVGLATGPAISSTEVNEALKLIDEVRDEHDLKVRTLGADKLFDTDTCLAGLKARNVLPHVSRRKNRTLSSKDKWIVNSKGFRFSQRCRRINETIWADAKQHRGFRKSRFVGRQLTGMRAFITFTVGNLVRISRCLSYPPSQAATA
jgi:transposase